MADFEGLALSPRAATEVVTSALAEDAPAGDVTSAAFIPATARATAALRARVPGVLSGAHVFTEAMRQAGHGAQAGHGSDADSGVRVRWLVADGEKFDAGALLAEVTGPARAVLTGERVGLNLLQRMSAIATATASYVAAVAGSRARIVDTRKTTAGLRALERYAVRCGGGFNHRDSLSDAVMAKDNHLAVMTAGLHGAKYDAALTAGLKAGKARLSHTTHVEVEVDRLEQIEPVLAAGVDTIMLDNFSATDLAAGVAQVASRALVEASGNVNLQTVAGIAATGVDIISVGALTHSVAALDLGLDIDVDIDIDHDARG